MDRGQAGAPRAGSGRIRPRYCTTSLEPERSIELTGNSSSRATRRVEASLRILAGDQERGIVTFGFSDDDAFSVGLTCGGTIHLYVEPLDW